MIFRNCLPSMSSKLIVPILFALATATACGGGSSEGEQVLNRLNDTEIKYFTNGKRLYSTHCANCHMENGEGLGQLIPPLKGADYLLNDVGRAARIIVNGAKEPLIVNGIEYRQPMPGNTNLNASEVTEILTYITNAWGNSYGGVSLNQIKTALSTN